MDRRGRLVKSVAAAIIVVLAGCQPASLRPPAVNPGAIAAPAIAAPPVATQAVRSSTIHGRVDFPQFAKTQAVSEDVVNAATVSLIDTNDSTTIASGKTDAAGNFTISLGVINPGSQAYILEAIKGLSGNAPGKDTARFRTILKYESNAWASCTNPQPGVGKIVINAQTTALAIEAALDSQNVPMLDTIGRVNVSAFPATYFVPLGYEGHPDVEFESLAADLLTYLSADHDPVGAVGSILPEITALQPTTGLANSLVQINGKGFSPTLSGNTVTFATGQLANVVLATSKSMIVQVPASAQTGAVTVQTSRGSANSAFTVAPGAVGGIQTLSIASFEPSNARAGDTVTLTGQFGTTPGTVYFAGTSPSFPVPVSVPAASWSATSVQVVVPTSAQYGRIAVSANGANATSSTDFDTWQGDLGYMVNLNQLGVPGAYTMPYSGYGNSTVVYYSTPGNTGTAKYIYQIAGTDNTVAGTGGYNVYMWPVAADGTLGATKWVGRLNVPRYHHSSVIVGNFLYVIGGYDGKVGTYYAGVGPSLQSIERANINPADGTLSTFAGSKGAFDQVGNLLSVGGRYHHKSFTAKIQGVDYIWSLGGQGSTAPTNRTDYDQFSVNTTTGALTVKKAGGTLQGTGGTPFSMYQMGGQLIGTGILLVGGYYNGTAWSGSMNLQIDQTAGATSGNLNNNGTIGTYVLNNCPNFSQSYAYAGGQLSYFNLGGTGRVYMTGGFNINYNAMYSPEANKATVNTANGQIINGANQATTWTCGSAGSVGDSWSRNQQYYSGYNDQNAVVTNGGVNRMYIFGGYGSSWGVGTTTSNFAIQYTEINADGSMNRTHQLGSTRDWSYAAATPQLGNKAWIIGGRRESDAAYVYTSEYYTLRDDGIVGAPVMGPPLATKRYYAMWTNAKGFLYVLGGNNSVDNTTLDSVERAQINADGTLQAFTTLPQRLNVRSYSGAALTIGNYLYVFGGYHPQYGALATIERAVVNSDGSLGSFEVLPNFMPYTTYQHSVKQVGNYLYLLSGQPGTIASGTTLRAQVYSNGDIGAFTRPYGSDFVNGGPFPGVAAYGGAVEVMGNYLYRCGGVSDQSNCDRAFINLDGTLGIWQAWTPHGRSIIPNSFYDYQMHSLPRWRDKVYLLSGYNNYTNSGGWYAPYHALPSNGNILVAPLR